MSDDEKVYEDDTNYMHWLKVEQFAMLFDPETEMEEELWSRSVGKYSVDEAFVPDSGQGMYSVDIRPDDTVTQHDWISSETVKGELKFVVKLKHISDCGKSEDKCYDFSCKHQTVIDYAELERDIRQEFLQMWTSLTDRPNENEKFGLPGLRYVEHSDNLFYAYNVLCSNCKVYTPRLDSTCHTCESVLVNH